jgi:hypothetical protein
MIFRTVRDIGKIGAFCVYFGGEAAKINTKKTLIPY